MKILITGGAGYLGSVLVPKLAEEEIVDTVIIVDKFIYGTSHISSLIKRKVQYIVSDVADIDRYKKELKSADVIIHLAALVGAPLVNRKPSEAHRTNIELTKLLAENISTGQRLIFASTGSCYGVVDGVCDENVPISPGSIYGAQKAQGEDIVRHIGGISLRFSTVFGLSPKMRDDLFIHTMLQRAIIDRSVVMYQGEALRSFMSIDDAARAISHFALKQDVEWDVYNVGDPALSYTKLQICKAIEELTSFTVVCEEYSQDLDNRDYTVNFDRLFASGFNSACNFELELERLYMFYSTKFYSGYENG